MKTLIQGAWLWWIAVSMGLGSCVRGTKFKSDSEAKRGGERPPTAVVAKEVAPVVTPRVIEATAPLEGFQEADVFPKVTGRLSQMVRSEGAAVRANDVLFLVDRSDPGEVYQSVPTVSPIPGWVGRWRVHGVGEQVGPTTPVVTIVNDTKLVARLDLPAEDWLAASREGVEVSLEVSGVERTGAIKSIARAAAPETGRGHITVIVDNGDHQWRAGVLAKVRLKVEPKERLLLDASALAVTDQGSFVYVVEANKGRKQPVTYRLWNESLVEITSGLKPKDQVVIVGGHLVSDGAPVKMSE
jgi:multidrug efflux pump subunit AcrA (membrane-fusion protein)